MEPTGVLVGFGVGVLVASVATWLVLRRALQAERAAETRARRLEHLAEVGAMTGGLAHEIKNPLSTLGLNAQLLAEAIDESSLPDDQKSRLLARVRTLGREADRLGEILQDFLRFAGRVHVQPRDVDVNDVVGELVDFFLPEAERRGVRLRAEPAPAPIPARFDVALVKQALLNLMLNATQAMERSPRERHGEAATPALPKELILRVGVRRDRAAAGSRGPAEEVVVIDVIDTGPGIDEQTRARIFEPYFTTKPGGSGLGLPTSRRLIEEQGGRLEVHSDPGRGSAFSVIMPRYGVVDADERASN